MLSYKQFRKEELPDKPRRDMVVCRGTNGALGGVMYCSSTEFDSFGCHEDQEGFLVLEGRGEFYCDGKVLPVEPDTSLLISAGVKHCFRKFPDSQDLKVFYFHCAN